MKHNCSVNMEKAMAPHSSTLTWKISWVEEPGGLQSMGSLRVQYNWATSLSLFPFMHWRRKWQSTPVFLPGESPGEPGGLLSMGSHRVGHDWSDLAAVATLLINEISHPIPQPQLVSVRPPLMLLFKTQIMLYFKITLGEKETRFVVTKRWGVAEEEIRWRQSKGNIFS